MTHAADMMQRRNIEDWEKDRKMVVKPIACSNQQVLHISSRSEEPLFKADGSPFTSAMR